MTSTPIRVLLVDDQPLLRTGFRMILESEPDIRVVGEADNGVDAVDEARRLQPDVVLMDIRMPRLDGVAATRRLMDPPRGADRDSNAATPSPVRVLILTTFRPRRVRDRGPAGRSQRVPAQGRSARAPGRRHPRRRPR